MQLFAQLCTLSVLGDEGPDYLHFIHGAGFKSTGVMEDEVAVTLEYHLMFDVMYSSL